MPLLIHPVMPYNFDLSCRIFSDGDPRVRVFREGIFRQIIRVAGKAVLVRVRDMSERGKVVLGVECLSRDRLTGAERRAALERVSQLLSLRDDLNRFYSAIQGDTRMVSIAGDLYGLRIPASASAFEALVVSIIEQQISIRVARVLEARLVQRFGERIDVAGTTCFAYPGPGDLAGRKAEEFRACGLSARKGEYIINAAEMVAGGSLDLESLAGISDPGKIIDTLCELRGIGRWTAEFVLLRGLHRLGTIPADDLGVRRAIARVYCPGRTISAGQARAIAENWGEWKGLAAYYLLTAEHIEKEGIQYDGRRMHSV